MSESERNQLVRELNIMQNLVSTCFKMIYFGIIQDHPNIVKLYEYFEDERRYYIINEICNGGELFEEMQKRGRFSERDAAVIVR